VAGRTLAGPRFPDDDGSAGPNVTAALAAYAAGQASEHAVLVALDSARLMVPVVALLAAEDAPGPDGLRREANRIRYGPYQDTTAEITKQLLKH